MRILRRAHPATKHPISGFNLLPQLSYWAVLIALANCLALGCDKAAAPKLAASFDCSENSDGVRFSADGTLLVAQDRNGLVVWDVPGGKIRATPKNVIRTGRDFAFGTDAKHLLLADITRVKLFDLDTERSTELYRHEEDVVSIRLSPDKKLMATCDLRGNVTVWDFAAGKTVRTFKTDADVMIFSLDFFPDGKTLAGVGGKGSVPSWGGVRLWDIAGMQEPRQWKGYKYTVEHLAISPDGKTLVTPGDSAELWLWDPDKGAVREKWSVGFKLVHAIAYAPDGRTLLAGGGEGNYGSRLNPGEVAFWDAASGKKLLTFNALDDTVDYMALSPDARLLAVSCSHNLKVVKIWDVSSITQRPAGDK